MSVGSFRQSVPETTKSPLKLSSSAISDSAGQFPKDSFSSSPKEKEREGNFFSVFLFPVCTQLCLAHLFLPRGPLHRSSHLVLSPFLLFRMLLFRVGSFVWTRRGLASGHRFTCSTVQYFLHTWAVESVDCGRYEDFFEALPRCIWGEEERRRLRRLVVWEKVGRGGGAFDSPAPPFSPFTYEGRYHTTTIKARRCLLAADLAGSSDGGTRGNASRCVCFRNIHRKLKLQLNKCVFYDGPKVPQLTQSKS